MIWSISIAWRCLFLYNKIQHIGYIRKKIVKNITKIILFVILIKNGFFCVRKLQKEVQKDRKTYTPRIPSDEPFLIRSQARSLEIKIYILGGRKK